MRYFAVDFIALPPSLSSARLSWVGLGEEREREGHKFGALPHYYERKEERKGQLQQNGGGGGEGGMTSKRWREVVA